MAANQSLQVQLDDALAMLGAREQEIQVLISELNDSAALRSKLEGQQDEIESIKTRLGEKQLAVRTATEREMGLQHELTAMGMLNKTYNELVQDYAYLSSQYKDLQQQVTALNARNFELQQIAGKAGELQSRLDNALIERQDLESRIVQLESQKYLREFNL